MKEASSIRDSKSFSKPVQQQVSTPNRRKKIALRLSVLDLAKVIDDVDLPGFFLHPLTGARNGQWSVTVTGNWRITFELVEGDVYIVNYEDYH